jgi:hypothetical protein
LSVMAKDIGTYQFIFTVTLAGSKYRRYPI